MAWNRPTSNTGNATSSSRPSGRGKMPRLRRGLLAGVIVVLGAGLAAWLLTNREATSASLQKKKRGRIREVTPAAAPKCKQEAVDKPKKLHYWEQATTNGLSDWQIAKWRNSRLPPPAITNTAAANRPPPEYAIFGTRAENEIAALITMPPGTMVVGTPEYGEEFKQQFLKSCETPIIIEKDDSDYVRQLKKDMIDLKIECRVKN